MPGAAVDIGHGTTITFGTSGFTAQLTSLRWSGVQRNAIETTHMGTTTPAGANKFGTKTFVPSDLVDPGELTLDVNFNPNTNLPIENAAETVTVTFPLAAGDATPASWSGSGFVTSFDLTIPLEEKMTATMVVKLTGNITYTDAT